MPSTRADDRAPWRPLGQLGQGSSSRQPTGDLRDPFLSPTEDCHDFPSPTHGRGQGPQYNSWGYQMSSKEDDEDYDTASLTAYSPSAASFRRRSTYGPPSLPPKPWYAFHIPHPFPEKFEAPPLLLLLLHLFFCAITYPALYFTCLVATGRSLFWARVLVGAGCGIMGFSLSITILELAQALLEASTWATLIHQSNVNGILDSGMRLRDLCVQANEPKSVMSALFLLWGRRGYAGTRTRNKGYYDGQWWTGYILLFMFSVILAACLPFIFGRTVDISTISQMQNLTFEEVLVGADLSPADLEKAAALEPTFTTNILFTWTLEPFSVHGGLPTPLALEWANETVYFSEVIQRQLQPNGTGFGTFESEPLAPRTTAVINSGEHKIDSGLDPGAVLAFPRWGIRIHCERIPNLANNMIPFSPGNLTYLFTPRTTVQRLFDHFNLNIPADLDKPLNVSNAMLNGDTFPSTMDPASTMLAAAFWANGVAINVKSTPVSMGADGRGFVTLENVLIRLNNSYAPHSTFPYHNPSLIADKDGNPTFIGYDAAICLELYEPWILNVYNTSVGPPTTMSIHSKVNLKNMDPQLSPPSPKSKLIKDPNVKRMLNSSTLQAAYIVGHENSVNQVIKDNGRDSLYVPSPTLVSFTDGSGPLGYTAFDAERYAKSRAIADASNVLPYFTGSGQLVARCYKDKTVSIATLNEFDLIAALVLVSFTGLICAIFIPRLPLGVPRRGFNLYSWILAFHAKEVEVEGDEHIVHGMPLDHLQDYASEATLRYRIVRKTSDKMGRMADEPEEFLKYRPDR